MKKLILLPFILMGMYAHAQTEKGTLMVGAGILSAGETFQNDNSYYNINLNPRAGWFITDRLAIGTTVLLGINGGNGGNITNFNYGLLPFGRYYFGTKKTALFAEADFGIQAYHVAGKGFSGDRDGSEFSFGAGPGVTHFLTPNVGLEALLKVRSYSGFNGGHSSVTPSLNLGFQIYLKKRSKTASATD